MKHANISIFIPHIGCPHKCSFCDQRTISGTQKAPTGAEVREICSKALAESKSLENTEIAFFGGSFTAIPKSYMCELLLAVQDFIGEGKFKGIRISTRPDYITPGILDILKEYGVKSIELGAQSMVNHVLEANERGHTAEDVYKASDLIKSYGFELGLQMMIGLYESTADDELETMEKIIEIRPDTVRIYPVVVLKNTKLGELYKSGSYRMFTFEQVVNMSSSAMAEFERNGIRVIKCGLHASEFVEKDMLGGFYHPAFRELCEGLIYRYNMEYYINETDRNYIFAVNSLCISKAVGQKKSNIEYFSRQGINIKIIGDENILKYHV
ncbi:MAG: radical SAM protein, partial [Ruminococcus sp.]|nr:radical SAM protein [Ruminococcus sp.]